MIWILLLSFAAAATLALGVAALLEPSPVRPRIERLRELDGDEPLSGEGRGILADDEPSLAGRALSALAGRGLDESSPTLSRTRRRLVQAGYRRPSTLRIYLGSRVALALLFPLLAMNGLQTELDSFRVTLLLCLAAVAGLVLPSFLLDRRIAARQRQLAQGLPDALDLMVVCIEAGLGLTASIARVAGEYVRSNPVLAEEFELVALEAQAGRSTVDALRGLAERTGLTEVNTLVAMLIQTERFGTSVADALRVHAEAMRERRTRLAEECAAKAPLKMLFPAGLFIFPATLLVIAGPGVIRLISTLQGNSTATTPTTMGDLMTIRSLRTAGYALLLVLLAGLLSPGCITTNLSDLMPRRDGSVSQLERYREQRAAERALAEAESEAEQRRGASVEELLAAGDRYRDAGELATALFTYIRAHKKAGDRMEPEERIAFIHLRKDAGRAQRIFEQVLAQNPPTASARMGLALSLLAQDESERARAELMRAVELAPDSATPRALLGVVNDRLDDHEAAQLQYEVAHGLRPNDPVILNNLGVSQIIADTPDRAVETLRKAVRLGTRDAAVHNNLGLALGLVGRYDEAFAEFAQVAEEPEAHNNLGYVLYVKGEYDRALAHLERALDVSGGSLPTVLQNIELVREALGAQAPELGFEAIPLAGISSEVIAGEDKPE